MNIPDNYDMWGHHEARQTAWLQRQPICEHCGKHIQDERLFKIEGELYHTDCAEELFLEYTEDYEK